MNDSLTHFLSENINISSVKKIYRLVVVLLIVSIIYYLLDILDWYMFLQNLAPGFSKFHNAYYRFTIQPVVAIIVICCNATGIVLSYQGYQTLLTSIESKEYSLLQKVIKNFYIANIAFIFSFISAIISITYRVFFLNNYSFI